MSPLACSLLALAALFAVATAIMPDPFCGYGLSLGLTEGKDIIDFEMTVAEGRLTIPDKCSRPGRNLVGESISACDPYAGKPNVNRVYDNDNEFEQVDIKCPQGCSEHITVGVTQYCAMVTAPIEG